MSSSGFENDMPHSVAFWKDCGCRMVRAKKKVSSASSKSYAGRSGDQVFRGVPFLSRFLSSEHGLEVQPGRIHAELILGDVVLKALHLECGLIHKQPI